MHHAAAPRGLGADICRDGGAAERARFEIVLGSDVYQGSNPCLCATKNGMAFAIPFFVTAQRQGEGRRLVAATLAS